MGQVRVEFTGDPNKLINALNRASAAMDKLERNAAGGMEKTKGKAASFSTALSKSFSKAFDPSIVTNFVAGFIGAQGFSKIMGAARQMFDEMKQKWLENKQAVDDNIDALTRFSAISSLGAKDRELVLQNVGQMDVGTASLIAFSARSAKKAGFDEQGIRDILKEASAAKQLGEDPTQFARSIIALKQGVFGGKNVAQISSFLTKMAEASPLTASEFAPQFARVGGIAGISDEDKAAGAALISAVLKATGAEGTPELASTAVKGFLARRMGPAAGFLESLGLKGKGAAEQILSMSQMATGPKAGEFEADFIKAFGQRTGPYLLSLLRSPEALAGIMPDVAAGLEALGADTSLIQSKVAEKALRDPEWAMVQKRRGIEARRGAQKVRRGYTQAPVDLAVQETLEYYEEADPSGVGYAGFGAVVEGITGAAPQPDLIGRAGALLRPIGRLIGAIRENTAELKKRKEAVPGLSKGPDDEGPRPVK